MRVWEYILHRHGDLQGFEHGPASCLRKSLVQQRLFCTSAAASMLRGALLCDLPRRQHSGIVASAALQNACQRITQLRTA